MHNYIMIIAALLMFLNPHCDNSSSDPEPGQSPPIIIFDDIDQIDLHRDAAHISKAGVDGRYLTLTVSYSGGCKEHEFALYGYSRFAESNPPQAEVFLSHNANGDMCEAYLTEELSFDLLPLRRAYQKTSSEKGVLVLNIYAPGINEPFMPKPVYDF